MSMCRAALIAAGMTLAGALAAHAADPAEVLQLVLKAEAGCRGSNDPDSPATKRACDEWGVRSEQLEKLGWCYWWPIDKIHADPEVRWRPCSPAERYANAHQKPVKTSADDQQRVAAAEARCKAAAGGPPARKWPGTRGRAARDHIKPTSTWLRPF